MHDKMISPCRELESSILGARLIKLRNWRLKIIAVGDWFRVVV